MKNPQSLILQLVLLWLCLLPFSQSMAGSREKSLPLATRKMLYIQYWQTLDLAQKQTDVAYPGGPFKHNQAAYNAYEHKMEVKYIGAFRRKYHLSEKQQDAIEQEGIQQEWPQE